MKACCDVTAFSLDANFLFNVKITIIITHAQDTLAASFDEYTRSEWHQDSEQFCHKPHSVQQVTVLSVIATLALSSVVFSPCLRHNSPDAEPTFDFRTRRELNTMFYLHHNVIQRPLFLPDDNVRRFPANNPSMTARDTRA